MTDQEQYRELAAELIEDMKRDGEYGRLLAEQQRRPGSSIRVKPTEEGGLEFSVIDPQGPAVWTLVLHLLLFGVILASGGGWLASWLYQWFVGPIPNLDALFIYRGTLFGVLCCFIAWGSEGWWQELSESRKLRVALVSAVVLSIVLLFGVALQDLRGTIGACTLAATQAFRLFR